jgi:hypothetical protein
MLPPPWAAGPSLYHTTDTSPCRTYTVPLYTFVPDHNYGFNSWVPCVRHYNARRQRLCVSFSFSILGPGPYVMQQTDFQENKWELCGTTIDLSMHYYASDYMPAQPRERGTRPSTHQLAFLAFYFCFFPFSLQKSKLPAGLPAALRQQIKPLRNTPYDLVGSDHVPRTGWGPLPKSCVNSNLPCE